MPMNMVVLGEESVQELAGLDQAAERAREVVQVLQGLELRLGEWVVVGDPRSGMGAGDTQICLLYTSDAADD